MIRLRKIRQLEVDREGLGDAVRGVEVHFFNRGASFAHKLVFRREAARIFAPLNQKPAQLLDALKECVAALFDKHAPEEYAERAHVPS